MFASEGYSQGSLIYSCITYEMNTFAALPFTVEREEADGVEVLTDHPAAELMRHPAPYMDGSEFARTLMLHLMTSGNAYIEKVREPRADGIRIAGQVQSLGLIRPDYVKIRPGDSRDEDRYVVEIEGVERGVLERPDVIHIKLPNPTNDFYGMSPINLITREGTIDLHMSDFELAFFRNAGVPYYVLKSKTRMTAEQKSEAKGAFRRAFGGFSKWWDLLIMNADDGELEQLGLPNNQMEMPHTRDLVESRISAVLGVPAVIVGALVGLKNSPWSEMKTAYRKYYSDTLTPLAGMIAAPLTRELLPEFATSATPSTDLRAVYSFAKVDALREDTTEKAKAAGELIKTGGVTVHDSFATVGLEPPEESDFYVVPSASEQSDAPATDDQTRSRKRKDALDDAARAREGMLGRMTEEIATLAAEFEPVVAKALAEQGKAATRRLELAASVTLAASGPSRTKAHGDVDPDVLITEADISAMLDEFGIYEERAIRGGWDVAGSALGDQADFDLNARAVQTALGKSGGMIREINEETRKQVAAWLTEADDLGLTLTEIVNGTDDFPGLSQRSTFSPARARMIARTEMANAQAAGAVARYREAQDAGVEVTIRVADGDGCGWTSHDDPQKADGMMVTVDEFDANPIAHPNCIRAPIPVVPE